MANDETGAALCKHPVTGILAGCRRAADARAQTSITLVIWHIKITT